MRLIYCILSVKSTVKLVLIFDSERITFTEQVYDSHVAPVEERSLLTKSMVTRICRLCLSEVRRNHCTALFSKESLKDDLPARLSGLLLVDLSQDDQLSPYICRKCKSNFQSLESKLKAFRLIARVSQERVLSASTAGSPQQVSRSPMCLKRVKDTSGIGVSPHTAQARPQSKRPASRRLFSDLCECECIRYKRIHQSCININIETSGVFDKHVVTVEAKCIQVKIKSQ